MKTAKTIIFSSLAIATIFLAGYFYEKESNLNLENETTGNTSQIECDSIESLASDSTKKREKDSNWMIYKNELLGFSINYPTKIIEDGNPSKTGKINIEESKNTLTLSSPVTHSSYELFIYDLGDKTLESIIAEKYGKDCLIQEITTNGDIENFEIKNPAKNLGEFDLHECTPALGKYSKKYSKLVTYRPPQWCIFWTDVNKCVDGRILDSIEFIKK